MIYVIFCRKSKGNIMKTTINDVAAEAGVSVSTASKALRGTGTISQKTRDTVLAVAEKLQYKPNRSAMMLSKKSKTIGFLCNRSPSVLMDMFETGFREAAEEYGAFGLKTRIRNYSADGDDFEKQLAMLSDADGIIIMPCTDQERSVRAVQKQKVPVITVQSGFDDESVCPGVFIDALAVGRMAAEFLGYASRRPKTAVICGSTGFQQHRLNIQGFLEMLEHTRLQYTDTCSCHDRMDEAAACTHQILQENPDIGSIFVTSYVTPAVCRELVRQGKRDVAVVGMDIYDESACCMEEGILNGLICQNQMQQAKKAVELLFNALCGETPRKNCIFKPELVLRSNLPYYR